MSLNKEEMYPYVRTILQSWYPENRGWKIYARNETSGIVPDFLMEKKAGDHIERSICAVEPVKMINEDHVSRINHYTDSLSGKNVAILEKILAVPTGTDTSCVPKGISVIHLRKFPLE